MEITEQGIRGVMVQSGEEILIAADTMVLAAGSRNRRAEAMQFNNCAGFVGMAGDCPGAQEDQAGSGGWLLSGNGHLMDTRA